jgi:hypothetical protein
MSRRNRRNGTAHRHVKPPLSPAAALAVLPDQPVESESVPQVPETITIDRADYLEERKLLIEAGKSAAQQHDESILKLASGGLALTITFLDKIAANPTIENIYIVRSAWSFLVATILLTLLSFLTSQKASSRQIQILDDLVSGKTESQRNIYSRITGWLNPISYFTFVVGIALSVAVAWNNFKPGPAKTEGTTQMADPQRPHNPVIQPRDIPEPKPNTGYVPPAAPATGTKKDTPPKKDK